MPTLLSTFPFRTLKSAPATADNRGTAYLLQAGYIRQEVSGAYSYLPLGLQVIENIKMVIREELAKVEGVEISMPGLGSREHWETTGRWDTVDVLFKLE
jgi:prolyl-tRNA synthetase